MSPWGVDCIIIPLQGARRAVSEGSGLAAGLPCGLSAPEAFLLPAEVAQDARSFPHIARFVLGPYGPGVATLLTT